MENSVDALKIAFGVLVFVIALTIAFMVLSQAKQTSDVVSFASDKTNYYQYSDYEERVVGVETVISTLYRYYTDSIRVIIKDKDGKLIGIFDTSLETEAPWRLNSETYKESINYFISGPTDAKINGTKLAFGGNRGSKNGTTYYLSNKSLKDYMDKQFTETFDEVKYTGSYIVDGDEELKITAGGTKLYITYTVKQ